MELDQKPTSSSPTAYFSTADAAGLMRLQKGKQFVFQEGTDHQQAGEQRVSIIAKQQSAPILGALRAILSDQRG